MATKIPDFGVSQIEHNPPGYQYQRKGEKLEQLESWHRFPERVAVLVFPTVQEAWVGFWLIPAKKVCDMHRFLSAVTRGSGRATVFQERYLYYRGWGDD